MLLGARSFHRRSLHHIGIDMNPYEEAISIIGRTLASFDEDNLIPCFGFGDGMYCDTVTVTLSLSLIVMYIIFQLQRMIKKSSVSFRMINFVMDLKRF